MLKIEITIGRPGALLAWTGALIAFGFWAHWLQTPASPTLTAAVVTADVGGQDLDLHSRLALEKDVRDARSDRAVADRQADIVRYQLELLEEQQSLHPDDAALSETLKRARLELLGLLNDQREAETRIAQAIAALRDDADAAGRISLRSEARTTAVAFQWPVEPLLGISAHYHDAGYQARFGVAHEGIDIPTDQGTIVRAPADAVVSRVNDRGLGYNSLVLSHAGGYATLYGHVRRFLVSEGQIVHAGDPIAESGGMPGTAGAGLLTTGPHLHVEIFKDGEHVDPETVLTAR